MLTLSGAPDCTLFGEFMIPPIHYIYITNCVLGQCLRINYSGLFAWISLCLELILL